MVISPSASRTRQAIDNRVNRDLIAQARTQGFTFSRPLDDFPIWHEVETLDLANPVFDCTPIVAEWLFCKAIEATLFQIYQHNRQRTYQRPIA